MLKTELDRVLEYTRNRLGVLLQEYPIDRRNYAIFDAIIKEIYEPIVKDIRYTYDERIETLGREIIRLKKELEEKNA